jgi:hypothetical protein
MMFVSVDQPVPDAVLARIGSSEGMLEARLVELPA